MERPNLSALRDATGISQSYASMILTGSRNPSRPLAICIYRRLGWRHEIIASLSDEQIAALESVEPWDRSPPVSPEGVAA